jgi:uroporphyrin-III C-methyltransferase
VGKEVRCHPVPQQEINALLIGLARAGRTVVRLKGGDPFIFGRGGEEAIALAKAGIPSEIVPGVTAAQACAAAARIPLTHRGVASGVRYLTGHTQEDGGLDFDWRGLSDPRTTLVVYMGLANIAEIAAGLMAAGRDPDTPALAVCRGATIHERRLLTTLGSISLDVKKAKLEPPTLFIIGEVAAFSEILGQSSDAPAPQIYAAE